MYLVDLGIKDYIKVHKLMLKLVKLRAEGKLEDIILLTEHYPVYTVGRNGKIGNKFINNIPVYKVERGGDITFHGPGQIVGYPIIKLDSAKLTIPKHILCMERAIIDTLKEYGINGYWIKGQAGVWTNWQKIASIGIAIRRWVSYHGFALNVNVDLKYFNKIYPCKLNPKMITSMEKILGYRVDMSKIRRILINNLFEKYLVNSEDRFIIDQYQLNNLM